MTRTASRCLAPLVLVVGTLSSVAGAQADRVLGRIGDGSGGPLADAVVRGFVARETDPWAEAPEGPATSPSTIVTRTDARGRFTLPTAVPLALWIDGGDRAAFVERAAPGVPVVVEAGPAAEVVLSAGAGRPAVDGARLRIDGVAVGLVEGPVMRLPAAFVEFLVGEFQVGEPGANSSDETWLVHAALEAGSRQVLERPQVGATALRDLPAGASVGLVGWPETTRRAADDGVVQLPRSRVPLVVEVRTRGDRIEVHHEVWMEPGRSRRFAPASSRFTTLTVQQADGTPIGAARVFSIGGRSPHESLRAVSTADAAGRAEALADAGITRYAIRAAGFADRSITREQLAAHASAARPIRLEPAHALEVLISDDQGQPVPDARVVVHDRDGLFREVHSDGHGRAWLDRLPAGPLALSIEHDAHPRLTTEVQPATTATLQLALARGYELHGRVVSDELDQVAPAIVEVRAFDDPSSLGTRTARVDAEGRFSFRGLPETPLVLRARRVVAGVTWSGALIDVLPGREPVTIEIACDDPSPVRR